MDTVYDYAIIGAGCSGMSLAVELLNSLPGSSRIAVLDPRQAYHLDRVWCFWKTMPHRFSQAIRHEWGQWIVRHQGHEVKQASSQFPYQYLPADTFYATALDVINRNSSADLLLKTVATDITENESDVSIATNKGTIKAHVVFDGRNDPNRLSILGCLLQHYTGQRLRTPGPVFDPHSVTLMDFDVSQEHGITFIYVLPFSEKEALVEPTVFSHAPLKTSAYTDLIRDYLRDRFNVHSYDVLFQEQGIIPMTTQLAPPKMPTRVIPIGTTAGMVKGSTGYGFLAIQKWSQTVARRIVKDSRCSRLPLPRSRLSSYLDEVFLSYIDTYPSNAPEVFFRLFERVPSNRLVRFLSDRATPADIACVIAAMPKRPFIRQAAQVMVAKEVAS